MNEISNTVSRQAIKPYTGAKKCRERPRTGERKIARQLHKLMSKCGYQRSTGEGVASNKTFRDRLVVLTLCLRVLHRRGYKIQQLENLRAEHLYCVVEDCRERGLMPATVASYMSHLRCLCYWVGKPQLVDELSRYLEKYPGLTARSTVATRDKSLTGAGVDPIAVIRRAADICPYFSCQLALGLAIGCRAQESWLCQPHLIDERTGYISITRGTKGGRQRLVSTMCTYEHVAVLNWARVLVSDRSGWMIPPGSTLKKWRRRFYYLCEKIGLTRKQLKVTQHGFRHERLNDLYTWLTGSESPIRGGSLHKTNKDADKAARQVIATVAGHNRIYVSGAYVGGMQALKTASTQVADAAVLKPESQHDISADGSNDQSNRSGSQWGQS